MTHTPFLLDLRGRRVVVVGGGPVALRRGRTLVEGGALLRVVSPAVLPELAELADDVRTRPYAGGDLAEAWFAVTATGRRDVDDAVAADAAAGRVWCVRSDDGERSSAWVPAVLRREDVTVAVSAGGDPRRAARLRDAVALALDMGTLPVRRSRPGLGRVSLVGGGPGDPGLLTVQGRRLLAEADVVVADRLAPRALLAELDPAVEVLDVGKSPGRGTAQSDINALLVDRARAGRRVVRLKGGDPFVFGRGGEEMLACIEAGVPVDVVPGVTSAVAVPACAGIPVTHRGIAQDFAVVSAHLDPGDADCTVEWDALATGRGTIVLLMAMSRLERVCKELVARGRDGATPAAIVADGTLPGEQVVVGTLDDLAARAADEGVGNPAVVVVGDVVALRARLAPR